MTPTVYSIKLAFIILILILLIFIIERFIIYNIIYFILFILSEKLFSFKNYIYTNIFTLKIRTILFMIYLHLLLARAIILSIVFIQGGLLKRFIVYEQFKLFINSILMYCDNLIEKLNKNETDNIKYYITKLEKFKNSFLKMKSQNTSFVLEEHCFEDEMNKIFEKYNDYLKNKYSDLLEKYVESLTKSIGNFSLKLEFYTTFSILDQFFKFKYTNSLLLMEEYMMNSFDSHTVDKVNITGDFDIYVLSPINNNNNNILAIYCNQNALCCENYAIGHDNINLYLYDLNSTIILWNYKGFGLRKGFTTFAKIDKDIEILSAYIKKKFVDYKIIVHGCSIGGYSSIKLTQKLKDLQNIVLISDRTFGDIDVIAKSLWSFGDILYKIYNIIFPKFLFHSNNVENYLSLPSDKKLICFDANDEIIAYNPASLVFNLTKKYYNDIIMPKIIKYEEYKSLIEKPNLSVSDLKQLASDCNDKSFDQNGRYFIQHLYHDIHSVEDFFMFFIVFAYPFNRTKKISCVSEELNKNYLDVPKIMKNFVDKHKNVMKNDLVDLIKIFNFLFIKFNLKTDINDNDIFKMNYDISNSELFKFDDHFLEELHKYFGYVHRIFCGHNGKLSSSDITAIIGFLRKNKFI